MFLKGSTPTACSGKCFNFSDHDTSDSEHKLIIVNENIHSPFEIILVTTW